MSKTFPATELCNRSHRASVEAYCTQCTKWTCAQCKEEHLAHEGFVKGIDEVINEHSSVYHEHMKQLKSFFRQVEQLPSTENYDEVKSKVISQITNAYDQLLYQINKHREIQIRKVTEYIESAKKKRLKLDTDAKFLRSCMEDLQKIISKLKLNPTNEIPKDTVIKYNNPARIKYHEENIEEVKNAVERCIRIQDKFLRFETLDIKPQFKDALISKLIQIPTNFKNEPHLVLLQPKSKNLIVANLDTMRKRLISLGDENFKFPAHFEFIEVKYRIIVCGGINEKGHFVSDSYRISLETKIGEGVRQLPNMEVAKNYHSLAALSNTLIYSVGGLGLVGPIRVCESFNLFKNEWSMQSPLNEVRQGAAVCSLGGKYLYCIGGRGKDKEFYTSMEVIDITYPKLGWSLIQLPEDLWQPVYFALCAPIDHRHVLVAGGINAKGSSVSDAYILNAENYTLTKTKPMETPDCFFERDKKVLKGKVYAVAYESFAIHIYDISKAKWNIIKSNNTAVNEDNTK
eukprot:TRINITY_DN948_c0_g1_i18.p1 TRINITY_DN948_c0_g1~~TRINITY_DN948_c0_g1_i18.p1  ORF type:complete len:515 (-),score=161.28 TRINITY_DN948_c0_g1_i18:141-1685(-)